MNVKSFIIIAICFLSLSCFPLKAQEPELNDKEVVRVAFFPIPNIYDKYEENQYSGFACEYIEKIAQYSTFSIEWVEILPQNMMSALQDGTIDIVATLYQDPQYSDLVSYSKHYFQNEAGLLVANKHNSDAYFHDLDYFSGKKVGISNVGMIRQFFDEFMHENNLSMSLVEYVSYKDMLQALENNDVDFIATSADFFLSQSVKIVDVFPTEPFYIAGRNSIEGKQLLNNLDRAMSKLHIAEPNFEANLYAKFAQKRDEFNSLAVTREESNFIKNNPTIKMGILTNRPPFSYVEEGIAKGFTIDYVKYLLEPLGFNVDFIKKDTAKEIRDALDSGEIALANFITATSSTLSTPHFLYSKTIPFGNLKLIAKKDIQLLSPKTVIGLPDKLKKKLPEFKKKLPYSQFKLCNAAKCIDEVISGDVDAIIQGEYLANYIKQIPKYEHLQINILDLYPLELQYIIDKRHTSPALISLINKTIDKTDRHIKDDILLHMSVNSRYKMSTSDFIFKYKIIILLSGIIFIISLIAFYFYIGKKEQRLKYKLSKQEKELYTSLRYDRLTGLAKLETFFTQISDDVDRNAGWQGIICIDIYKFSAINEYYGREIGDELLCEIAKRLTHFTEPKYISRYGADEFCLFISLKDSTKIKDYLHSLDGIISKKYTIQDLSININCHYGISIIEDYTHFDPNIIYHQAALALNRANNSNSSKPVFFDSSSQQEINKNLQIVNLLPDAIKNQEIKVFYQPQVSARSGKVVGVEALVRWTDKTLGFIPPDRFIHIAEQHNLISQLDNYVLDTACREVLASFPNTEDALQLSVNISASELFQEEFLDTFIHTVRDSGMSLSRITVEVTESFMINDYSMTTQVLDKLRAFGFGVSIDDFGTGYSSLSYISNLPITELKIDKAFIDNIFQNKKDQDLIRSILAIGKISKSKVVAEGVETKEQAKWLEEERCDRIQGYFYAKPMPIDKLIEFMNKNQ